MNRYNLKYLSCTLIDNIKNAEFPKNYYHSFKDNLSLIFYFKNKRQF